MINLRLFNRKKEEKLKREKKRSKTSISYITSVPTNKTQLINLRLLRKLINLVFKIKFVNNYTPIFNFPRVIFFQIYP